MPSVYQIIRTVEIDGAILRVYQDGAWKRSFPDEPGAMQKARAVIEELKNPPKKVVVYEEVTP